MDSGSVCAPLASAISTSRRPAVRQSSAAVNPAGTHDEQRTETDLRGQAGSSEEHETAECRGRQRRAPARTGAQTASGDEKVRGIPGLPGPRRCPIARVRRSRSAGIKGLPAIARGAVPVPPESGVRTRPREPRLVTTSGNEPDPEQPTPRATGAGRKRPDRPRSPRPAARRRRGRARIRCRSPDEGRFRRFPCTEDGGPPAEPTFHTAMMARLAAAAARKTRGFAGDEKRCRGGNHQGRR